MTDQDKDPSLPERPPWLEPVAAEDDGDHRRARPVRLLIGGTALAVTILFAALIWALYNGTGTPPGETLVRAPEGPVKVAPEDRGGMAVPNQDKLVYDEVVGETPQVEERLRPEPETPVGRPEVPTIGGRAAAEPDEVIGAKEATAPATAGAQEAPSATAPAAAAQSWSIQIAAFQQKWHADSWLAGAEEDYREVFRGLIPRVEETERDRAKYYRIRFGPLPDRKAAMDRCAAVRKAGLNCIVVPPGR